MMASFGIALLIYFNNRFVSFVFLFTVPDFIFRAKLRFTQKEENYIELYKN